MKAAGTYNVLWAGVEAGVSATLTSASAFVIARLIGPSEFGIAAAAVAPHVLLWVGVNALFADALVQRSQVDDAMAASAFWGSAAVGTLAAALMAAAGWVVATSLGDSRLVAMCAVLALPLPLVGAAGVMQGMLTRRRAYRLLAWRAIVGQGLGTATGVIAALHGAGAWAPVLQQCLASAAGALTLLLHAGWWPRATWHWQPVQALLRVGLPLTASTLTLTARYRLFALLLAGTAGPAVLGQTHMAFRLVDTVRELCSTALWRLMLPIMAERQHDVSALRAAVDQLLGRCSIVLLPLCGVMALLLPLAVRLLLGKAWAPASQAAEALVALMGLLLLMFPAGVALVARGHTGRALAGNLACLIATLIGAAVLRPGSAIQAVSVWLGAQLLVAPYLLWANGRALGAGLLRPLRAALPISAVTLAGLAVALAVPGFVGRVLGPLSLTAFRLALFFAVLLAGAGWTGGGQWWHHGATARRATRGVNAYLRLWLRDLRPVQREPPDG